MIDQDTQNIIDLAKVEALDFDGLHDQLSLIFKDDEDITNFINFLKSLQKFSTLSNDKRHTTLLNLSYFRSQIQRYERQVLSLINKKKTAQMKAAVKKGKMTGERLTESLIAYYSEEDLSIEGLEKIHNVIKAWSDYLSDVYFVSGQTNKILGGYIN